MSERTSSDGSGQGAKPAQDAGWELGVRETVAAPATAVWKYLLGEGLAVWLGEIDALPTEKKATFETRDGVRGTIKGYTENSRVRLTWRPEDWPHDTVLQVSVKEVPTGTTIAIAHEELANREERKLMLGHWKNVLAAIAGDLTEW